MKKLNRAHPDFFSTMITTSFPCHIENGVWHCSMPECSREIPTVKKSLIVYHKNTHFPKYACESCDQIFPQKNRLEVHIRTAHTGEKPYACTQCDRTFPQQSNLNDHVKKHHTAKTVFTNPQIIFYKLHSRVLKEQNPTMTHTEIISKIREAWGHTQTTLVGNNHAATVPGKYPRT